MARALPRCMAMATVHLIAVLKEEAMGAWGCWVGGILFGIDKWRGESNKWILLGETPPVCCPAWNRLHDV